MRLQRTPRCRSRRSALAAALQDVAAQLLALLHCPVLGSLLLCPTSLLDLLEGLQPFIAQAQRVLQCPALCFALGKALRGDSPHHTDEVMDGTGGKYCGVAQLRQRLRTWLDRSGRRQPGCSVSPAWHRGDAGCLQPPCCARAGWVAGRLSLARGLTSRQTARELLINEPTHLSLQSLT